MSDRFTGPEFYVPPLRLEPPPRPPRISGTAMLGGVHLSTGSCGTGGFWQLAVSGLGIAAALGVGMALTYIELWLLEHWTTVGAASALLGPGTGDAATATLAGSLSLILPFCNFLLVLRLSPLSGYHAAEHKVVAAIEAYGELNWDQVVTMPRAHPRCGTVLLLGILPAMLIAYPMLHTNPLLAVVVAVLGWMLRYRVGYFIQQHFTTKTPTPEQLRAGIAAGRQILDHWRRHPYQRVAPARNLWNRGLPQMLAGVVLGQCLLTRIMEYLPRWLDW